MWQIKTFIILVNGGRVVALKCKNRKLRSGKPRSIIDAQFSEKDEIVQVNIIFAFGRQSAMEYVVY